MANGVKIKHKETPLRIKLSTIFQEEGHSTYEFFEVVPRENDTSVYEHLYHGEKMGDSHLAVHYHLKLIGFDKALDLENAEDNALRIVYEPVSFDLAVPTMRISPLEHKLSVNELDLKNAEVKPEKIIANDKGLHIEYSFLELFVSFKNNDRELKNIYGKDLVMDLEIKDE
jgi:hypothetical protein